MSVLLLAARFGQLKVIDMLWGQLAFDRASVKVRQITFIITVTVIIIIIIIIIIITIIIIKQQ